MPKYFMTWKVDPARMSVDIKERAVLLSGMAEMVKQQIRDGTTKDWGAFVGEDRGYSVVESSHTDLHMNMQKYYPFVEFETHQIITIDEIVEGLKSIM